MTKDEKPGIGHNKPPKKKKSPEGGVAQGQIRSVVKRIERLDEERTAISADISEIYAESKGNGLNVKALRAMIQRRKRDAAELQEMEAVLDLYEDAMGGE
jgi:uncharacterized protein (UPF0335 family)